MASRSVFKVGEARVQAKVAEIKPLRAGVSLYLQFGYIGRMGSSVVDIGGQSNTELRHHSFPFGDVRSCGRLFIVSASFRSISLIWVHYFEWGKQDGCARIEIHIERPNSTKLC